MPRKKKKGVIASLRDGGKKKSAKRKVGGVRKLLGWLGTAVAGAALLGFLVLVGIRFLAPSMGTRTIEAEVVVERVLPDRSAAFVTLQGSEAQILLEPERRTGVERGTRLWVRYVWTPQARSALVEEWRVVEP